MTASTSELTEVRDGEKPMEPACVEIRPYDVPISSSTTSLNLEAAIDRWINEGGALFQKDFGLPCEGLNKLT